MFLLADIVIASYLEYFPCKSLCFFKHHVEISSFKHNTRCIVIFTSDRALIFDEAHTFEFSWYQSNIEGLAIKAFCFLIQTNGPIFKFMLRNIHGPFHLNVSATRYFSFTREDRAIVATHWFALANIVWSKASHPTPSCLMVKGVSVNP